MLPKIIFAGTRPEDHPLRRVPQKTKPTDKQSIPLGRLREKERKVKASDALQKNETGHTRQRNDLCG